MRNLLRLSLIALTACGTSEKITSGVQSQEMVRTRAIAAVRQANRINARDSSLEAAITDTGAIRPDSSQIQKQP